MNTIADLLHIRPRLLRSIELERDFEDSGALAGYVLTPTARAHLERISTALLPSSTRRAWRVTGDYGSGKSTFGLVLARLIGGQTTGLTAEVAQVIGCSDVTGNHVPLLPILVTGTRTSVADGVLRGLERAVAAVNELSDLRNRISSARNHGGTVQEELALELLREVLRRSGGDAPFRGLLLILDEVGKFLEAAALDPHRHDVYFLQQLAELAARSGERPFIVFGLLHQGFHAYAESLTGTAQKEWEKVAGRFEELLFDAPLEETAELVAGALRVDVDRLPPAIVEEARYAMEQAHVLGWYGMANRERLVACAPRLFPLHPMSLPALARVFARFGQNQRSLFSFLGSSEPFGLQEFAARPVEVGEFYRLHHVFDYVRATLGQRLINRALRSHWFRVVGTIESLTVDEPRELEVLKAVGLLNLLDDERLLPREESLAAALETLPGARWSTDVAGRLRARRMLHLRGKAGGYRLWPHTSVDLERAYEEAARVLGPIERLSSAVGPHLEIRPLVARRHYVETGNLRHFEVRYAPAEELARRLERGRADGVVLVALCDTDLDCERAIEVATSQEVAEREELLVAVPRPLSALRDVVEELQRWEWVMDHTPELGHDSYAAEEVSRHLRAARHALTERVRQVLGLHEAGGGGGIRWFRRGVQVLDQPRQRITSYLSEICNEVYGEAPHVHNELVNRAALSAAAAAARMRIIEGVLERADEPLLGINPDKAPPEKAVYFSLFQAGRLHRQVGQVWTISEPDLVIERKTTQAEEEDQQFYEAHRQELREDRKLKSAWDKFVYGTPRETTDFLTGLMTCLESLFSQQYPSIKRRLVIRCDSRSKKDFRDLNVDAGLYFERRYKGLPSLFGRDVKWEIGELFRFSELVESWKTGRDKDLNRSEAKAALQLKFVVELQVESINGSEETYFAQMVWRYHPLSIASALVEDWDRLAEHPLVRCTAHRDPVTSKDGQSVDLANVRTLMPVYARDRGSFVPVYKQANDLGKQWAANLDTARAAGLVSDALAASLKECFERFQAEYGRAIRGWITQGEDCHAIERQAEAYSELLDALCRDARGDRNRDLLLRPLMYVGTVAIEGGRPAAVVAPWHPLRLAAMARKTSMVARLVRHLLTAPEIQFGDPRLFFNDYRELLQHPFYPELALGWRGNKPELLSLADVVADYSLHESPLALAESDATNENPTAGAAQVMELVQRYLALHPHEQANLAVVLYNCDSSRLPTAVVDKIGALHADEEDVRCQIVLRHRDKSRLRGLYEEIVETSDGDADAFNASEGTRDFMARLRISIMADQAPPPDPKDGCPADIAFSQDVIARHAHLEWLPQDARPAEVATLVPSRWSRRRPAARDDMKSVVYLCCPVQGRDGWAFLTALTTFLKGDWDGRESPRLLPARQLNFQDLDTSQIFTETHNLANWVVNYDELLDRRQLMNQNVRVIRYKQFATQGRNLIVSSKAPLGLLRTMVLRRLGDLNLDLDATEYARLAERFIDDANDVSGDIVLRAAKRGRNASELMGIVLSRYLVRSELGAGRHFGWYFLDDYASWLGQREEQIADVMALSPQEVDGGLRLTALVVESKYIDAASLAAKRKESQNQLRHTVRRIREAVFGAPHRLDRELWLARLSDLLLDGVQFPASANLDLDSWRRGIREGHCELHVRGYSHVFVPSPDTEDCSDFAVVSDLEDAYQEIFGRPRVRDLVLRYHREEDPMPVRAAGADPRVWTNRTYVRSSDHTALQVSTAVEADTPAEPTGQPDASGPAPVVQVNSYIFPPPSPVPAEPEAATGWAFPGIALMIGQSGASTTSPEDQAWLRQVEVRARSALQQFQLQSKLASSVLTPNAALLKFVGSSNLTVDQVLRRRSEFLTTHGLNIISVQPEPGVVAIALERPRREVIHLQELWGRWKPASVTGNLDLLIGVREDDGELLILSPGKEHAPHTLIAGSTGSGKSVLMQNIILGIAATNTPEQARIILIDPKQGVDYFPFEGLPHLEAGIIDEQGIALERINALVLEMDERYRRLRDARTPNLAAYNQRVSVGERMAMLWLIHDEFAEWMMVDEYKQEVTAAVARLGVKARAAGIHLVFAAQRPDANVMPMQLRANLGNRLILRVDSEGTSEIALGERGAERLLGRGHLLAKLEGQNGLTYAQVPFASPDFIDAMVEMMRRQNGLGVQ